MTPQPASGFRSGPAGATPPSEMPRAATVNLPAAPAPTPGPTPPLTPEEEAGRWMSQALFDCYN